MTPSRSPSPTVSIHYKDSDEEMEYYIIPNVHHSTHDLVDKEDEEEEVIDLAKEEDRIQAKKQGQVPPAPFIRCITKKMTLPRAWRPSGAKKNRKMCKQHGKWTQQTKQDWAKSLNKRLASICCSKKRMKLLNFLSMLEKEAC